MSCPSFFQLLLTRYCVSTIRDSCIVPYIINNHKYVKYILEGESSSSLLKPTEYIRVVASSLVHFVPPSLPLVSPSHRKGPRQKGESQHDPHATPSSSLDPSRGMKDGDSVFLFLKWRTLKPTEISKTKQSQTEQCWGTAVFHRLSFSSPTVVPGGFSPVIMTFLIFPNDRI